MDRATNPGELAGITHRSVRPNLLRRGLWLLPLGLCLVFMLVVGLWAASNEAHDRQALQLAHEPHIDAGHLLVCVGEPGGRASRGRAG